MFVELLLWQHFLLLWCVIIGPCGLEAPYDGSCDDRTLIYYYHAFEDRCYPREGCPAVRGNENSFSNLQECFDTCRSE